MAPIRISETLFVEDGYIACNKCAAPLAPSATSWKPKANLSTVALTSLPGAGSAIHPQVVLRKFSCPSCGNLLDTETAMPGDPFLDDIVHV
jgi:acetone carboxylase gamma subunit